MPDHRHVFLEAHIDDAVLSCGGTLRVLASRGEHPLVVTVFAGNPGVDAVITEFAAVQHARWGGAGDPVAERVREQEAALALLGAKWRPLRFFDAIYRGDQYLSDEELFGELKASDAGLVEEARRELRAIAGAATLYVPLAIGGHVDHQIVHRASEGIPCRHFYGDYPYTQRHRGALDARVNELRLRAAETVAIDVDLKVRAIACYQSQIPTLFGDEAAMAQAVRAEFAAGERFWVS